MSHQTRSPRAIKTLAASTRAIWISGCVLGREFMAVDAMSLRRICRSQSFAAQQVHSNRDRLEVLRIHATPVETGYSAKTGRVVVTEMVQLESRGNCPNQLLVNEYVCAPDAPLVVNGAIAARDRTEPQPASRIGFKDYKFVENFLEGLSPKLAIDPVTIHPMRFST